MRKNPKFSLIVVVSLFLVGIPLGVWAIADSPSRVDSAAQIPGGNPIQTPIDGGERPKEAAIDQEGVLGNDQWAIEWVARSRQFLDADSKMDATGRFHIAYGGGGLFYAWHDGISWQYETVDDNPGVGRSLSMALDKDHNPHIVYQDSLNSTLKYASLDSLGWHIEIMPVENGSGPFLALDNQDNPHVSFYNQTNGDVQYAYRDASGWHSASIPGDEGEVVEWYTSLRVDANGVVHIAYSASTGTFESVLKYAVGGPTNWQIETVVVGGIQIGSPSLQLDGDGYPHIAYYDMLNTYNNRVKYAFKNASGWHDEEVGASWEIFFEVVLQLDESGNPHIAIVSMDRVFTYVDYVFRDSSGWQYRSVVPYDYYYSDISLALDEQGEPHITYIFFKRRLEYVQWDVDDWVSETVDTGWLEVGENSSLALDANHLPHISYQKERGELNYAARYDSRWHLEIVDDTQDFLYATSLALGKDGYPRIIYRGHNSRFYFAIQDSSGWLADSIGVVGRDPSMALDDLDRPHVSYYDDVNHHLKYAFQDASSWYSVTVDSVGDVGRYTSLALDDEGYPHISYYDVDNENLKYAFQDAQGWNIEVVDNVENVGQYSSLFLDSEDYPHIAYYDATNEDLKYAFLDDAGWNIASVDTEGNVGGFSSLELDASGYAHISYLDHTNGNLKYAFQDSSGWHILIVDDSPGYVGCYSSLALDGAGYPHISYWDLSRGDLKYAQLIPPLALDKQAEPIDGLLNKDGLTYTLVISGPALNVRLWDHLPTNTTYISGSVTAPASYSSTARAIMWQGTLLTETAQVIRFQVTPAISSTDEISLSLPIVNTAWLIDAENNREVKATVIVNGWHIYQPIVMRNN